MSSVCNSRPLFALAVASVLGVGYVPFAPGTCGSIAGLLLWFVLPQTPLAQGLAIVTLLTIGWWSGGIAERYFKRRDPSHVVIDEVMGIFVTLFMHRVGWRGAIGAFFLFRIFDVVKPYPANRLERLPGGLGVMADDFMAAVYANIALTGIRVFGNWVIW